MVSVPQPDGKTIREFLRERLDRFLIRGVPIDDFEDEEHQKEDGEFKLKPGWTIKG